MLAGIEKIDGHAERKAGGQHIPAAQCQKMQVAAQCDGAKVAAKLGPPGQIRFGVQHLQFGTGQQFACCKFLFQFHLLQRTTP